MLSQKMPDNGNVNNSLLFRLVKYLLMVMYAFDLVVLFLFFCLGLLILQHHDSAVQIFKAEVRDFEDTYDGSDNRALAIVMIITSLILMAITSYFIYAAYLESLRQNAIIAVITIFFTFLDLIFLSTSVENRLYSIWSVLVVITYVYLLDKISRSRMRGVVGHCQDIDVEANSDFHLI